MTVISPTRLTFTTATTLAAAAYSVCAYNAAVGPLLAKANDGFTTGTAPVITSWSPRARLLRVAAPSSSSGRIWGRRPPCSAASPSLAGPPSGPRPRRERFRRTAPARPPDRHQNRRRECDSVERLHLRQRRGRGAELRLEHQDSGRHLRCRQQPGRDQLSDDHRSDTGRQQWPCVPDQGRLRPGQDRAPQGNGQVTECSTWCRSATPSSSARCTSPVPAVYR